MGKELIILILNTYLLILSSLIVLYIIRHFVISVNRMFMNRRADYHELIEDKYDSITVMVPMHNEEKVIHGIMNALIGCDYPHDKMEIICVNDHSEDKTAEIIEEYVQMSLKRVDSWPCIRAFHRNAGLRGKQHALNEAMEVAKGDIILIFDADYLPPKDILRSLSAPFKDPKVGAVMGRVIPLNSDKNLLTRIQDLERTAGYQVDQQAKYALHAIPQYGGTVGGFRKKTFLEIGKFSGKILAEDTELTYKLAIAGWDVVYCNRSECYEECVESWQARAIQIQRWSRGHNQVFFTYFFKFLFSKHLTWYKKVDGLLVLLIYTLPFQWWISWFACFFLWFVGDVGLFKGLVPLIITLIHGSLGNFAPFFQIVTGCVLDGTTHRIKLLPLFFYYFYFCLLYTASGFLLACGDVILKRNPSWNKTKRTRSENTAMTKI